MSDFDVKTDISEQKKPAGRTTGNSRGWIWVVVAIGAVFALFLTCLLGAAIGWFAGSKYATSRSISMMPWSSQPWRQWEQLPESPALPQTPRRFATPTAPEEPGPLSGMITGALVRSVTPNTPADRAGIAQGDIILRVDDKRLDDTTSLSDLIGQYRPGDQVTLLVWMRGDTRTVKVELGRHPDDASRAFLGVTVVQATVPQAFERSTD